MNNIPKDYLETERLEILREIRLIVKQRIKTPSRLWGNFARMAVIALFLMILACSIASAFPINCHATGAERHYTDREAILAIIGEGESEGYTGMYALGLAIRNRGTLKGVYGIHSARVKRHAYSDTTYKLAAKAWMDSGQLQDITKGATGWGSKSDMEYFSKQKWFRKCVVTAKIGRHWFYRKGRT